VWQRVRGPHQWRDDWRITTSPAGFRIPQIGEFTLMDNPDVPGAELDVELDMGEDGTDPKVVSLRLRQPGGVTVDDLRVLPRGWDREVLPELVARMFAYGVTEDGRLGGPEAAKRTYKRKRHETLTDDVLREVARVYADERHHLTCPAGRCVAARPKGPRDRVATHWNMTAAGAAVRVRAARDAGFLPESTRKRRTT
jgi:hypothetical protein